LLFVLILENGLIKIELLLLVLRVFLMKSVAKIEMAQMVRKVLDKALGQQDLKEI